MKRNAFTLVELLVVIGVIALLIGLLLPALSRARQQGRSTVCMSNLRQMATAAFAYANNHRGRLPVSVWYTPGRAQAWDLTTLTLPDGSKQVLPGLLWQGETDMAIQQCPEFTGKSNWVSDPYTGYNYNTSYLGGGQYEPHPEPARITRPKDPVATAVFGDGEYAAGANKFMRAPRHGGRDGNSSTRVAGTQGFRHLLGTNVAFIDGHAATLRDRFIGYDVGGQEREISGERFGFLSEDNTLYDLE